MAVFAKGAAQLQVQSEADRARIGGDRTSTRGGGLVAQFEVAPQPLPNLPPLHGLGFPFPPAYRHGGYEVNANRGDELVEIRWPHGWRVLEWAARQHGLGVRPSTQGRVSMALIRRLGSIDQIRALLSPDLVDVLYELGQSKAMSWFKRELQRIRGTVYAAKEGPDEKQAAFEAAVARIGGPPTDERISLTDSRLKAVFGQSASRRAWRTWAETIGLLIRGVRVPCPDCGDRFWRTAGEAFSSPQCRGCGQPIPSSSFGPTMTFEYRASEPLLQVIEHDAIPHLFVLRWLWDAFGLRAESLSAAYGFYPGADFFDLKSGADYGDADVVLLLADGSLVPVECKLRAAGLNEAELQKFDRLTEKLGAPWSMLATLSRSSECGPLWRSAVSPLRRVLTAEHLYDPIVLPSLGRGLFDMRDQTDDDFLAQRGSFEADVRRLVDALLRGFDIEEMWLKDSGPKY